MSKNRTSIVESRLGIAVISAAVVVLFVGVGILVVTLLGGRDLSDDSDGARLPAFVGPAPEAPRSSVADLLANTSFDDMTAEDVASISAEVLEVFGQSSFRALDRDVLALDVVRRGGETRAWRQYRVVETPGDPDSLAHVIVMYCDGTDPALWDEYRWGRTDLSTEEAPKDTKARIDTPFQRLLVAVDWSQPKDLGYREINERQAHGVLLPFVVPSGIGTVDTEYWFDVENARLLRRTETTGGSDYTFDYREFARIEAPGEFSNPPCYDEIYPE